MAEPKQTGPDIEPNTLYVGQGVCLRGDVTVPGTVVVDGTIEGNITARTVWLSETGVIKGRLVATEAEIYGSASQTVEVRQLLDVHSTGRVTGDISYGELQLEKGAVLTGTLKVLSGAMEPALEPVLKKAERPKVVHRNEPARTAAEPGVHLKLPPADYRAAG